MKAYGFTRKEAGWDDKKTQNRFYGGVHSYADTGTKNHLRTYKKSARQGYANLLRKVLDEVTYERTYGRLGF